MMNMLLINKLTDAPETDFGNIKAHVAIPPNCRPINEFTAEWAQDEQRRQALVEARRWFADTFWS